MSTDLTSVDRNSRFSVPPGGRHNAIIVADLSRLSRDPAEVLAFAAACIRCDVVIEAIEEGRIDQSRRAARYTSMRPTVSAGSGRSRSR